MKPKFYSKATIGISTIFLSPFFGGILFAYNLREIGKGKVAPIIIIVGMFWMLLFRKLTESFLSNSLLQLFIGNLVGSVILTFILWDSFFLNYPSYDTKKVWKPLLVFVSICVALILLQFFALQGSR
jgi:hypothetical protein